MLKKFILFYFLVVLKKQMRLIRETNEENYCRF